MKKSNDLYLKQIADGIDKINKYIKGKSYQSFKESSLLQDAVVRNLEIVGEAAGRLSKDFIKKHKQIPLIKAVAMRHKLIHDYDEINMRIVWNTVKKDLKKLKKDVARLLF